jgi:DNA gyrase subunit B
MKADGGRGRLTVTIHAGGVLTVHAVGPAIPVGAAVPADLGLDSRLIGERLRELAFLNPGAAFELADERQGGRRVSFLFQGIEEWVALLTEGQAVFPVRPLRLRAVHGRVSADVALAWTTARDPRVRAFVDQRRVEHGAPLWGLYGGILRALRDGDSGPVSRPSPQSLRGGLVAIVDVRGGTGEDEVRDAVRQTVEDGLRRAMREDDGLRDGLRARMG